MGDSEGNPLPGKPGGPNSNSAETAGGNGGGSAGPPMPKLMQYGLGIYVVAFFFSLIYLLVKLWPLDLTKPETTAFFWGPETLPPEVRLMFLVAVAGGMGSYVHLATSFADYAGAERLTTNWGWWYLLRPFIGMALAEVVYVTLRGGLLSAAGNTNPADAISPYGVSAVAALTGLFSRQATDKLKEVFDTLFRTQEKVDRKDALPATPPAEAPKSSAAGVGK